MPIICGAIIHVCPSTEFYDCENIEFNYCTFYSTEIEAQEIISKFKNKSCFYQCTFLGKNETVISSDIRRQKSSSSSSRSSSSISMSDHSKLE